MTRFSNFRLLFFTVCSIFFTTSMVTASAPVTNDPPDDVLGLTLSLKTDLNCHGDNNGLAVVLAVGGLPPFVYLWSNGSIGPINASLAAGVYTVTCTDLLGATASMNVTINEPPALNVNVAAQTNINCLNATGSVTLNTNGGTGNSSILWASGQVGATLSNLNAGIYTAVATDQHGCTSNKTVTVTADVALPSVDINLNTDLQIDCNTLSVALDGSASAGGAGYSYLWTTVNGHISGSNTGNTCLADAAGSYLLKVTNNSNGCTNTKNVNVTADINLPVVHINTGANVDLQIDCLTPQIMLSGQGSATGSGIGYLWTTLNGHIVAGASTMDQLVVDASGMYTLKVTNGNTGCSNTQNVNVTADVSLPTVHINTGANVDLQIDCLTPQITLSGQGSATGSGIGYLWTTLNGHIVAGANTMDQLVVDASGMYSLKVTNGNNGCSNTQNVNVTADVSLPAVHINTGANVDLQIDCLTPQITLSGQGSATGLGIGYLWTTLNGHIVAGANTMDQLVVDASGMYSLKVTNGNNGCSNTQNVNVTADVSLPTVHINTGANVDLQIDCLTPQITLSGQGSATGSGIGYLWTTLNGHIVAGANTMDQLVVDASGMYTLKVTNGNNGCSSLASVNVTADLNLPTASAVVTGVLDCNHSSLLINGSASSQGNLYAYLWTTANGNIVTGSHTSSPTVNAAGDYQLLVTNQSSGCSSSVIVHVNGTPTLNVSLGTQTNVSCFGSLNGAVSLQVGGGTGAYTYLWSNGMSGATLNGLAAGLYTGTVTDGAGCQAVVNVNINQPNPVLATASTTPASSAGQSNGTASIQVTGGTAPYTYQWSNGMTGSSNTGLAVGTYTVVVTDAAGCSVTITITVGNNLNCLLSANVSATAAECGQSNGQASATTVNANGAITYNWSNGMSGAQISGLAAGTYNVTASDGQGCNAVATVVVTVQDHTAPIVITHNATIYLGVSGTAVLTTTDINNGSSDACSNIVLTLDTNEFDCSDVGAHIVVLTATDQNGNTSTGTATVTVVNNTLPTLTCPANVVANACDGSGNMVAYDMPTMLDNCSGGLNAAIMLTAGLSSGSNFPNGTTTVSYVGLMAGGIIATCSFTVTLSGGLGLSVDLTSPSCPGELDGSATVNVSGGSGNYSYLWLGVNGQTTATATGLGAGAYTVLVIDDFGCIGTQQVTLNNPTGINLTTTILIDNCDNTGSLNVSVTGGTAPYTYAWYDGNGALVSTDEDLVDVDAGDYMLVVTDANGCSFSTGILTLNLTTGTVENELNTGGTVDLAPNPTATGKVLLSLNLPQNSPVLVEMYTMNGLKVGSIQEGQFQEGQFSLDLAPFAPGQYLVKVITNDRTYVKKVMRIN